MKTVALILLMRLAVFRIHGQPVAINEINLQSFDENKEGRFVELKFSDYCLLKRTSINGSNKGPSLNGYALVFLEPGESGLGRILHIENLEGHYFQKDNPFFMIGFGEGYDIDLFRYQGNGSWPRIKSTVLEENGGMQIISLIYNEEGNEKFKLMNTILRKKLWQGSWLPRQSFFWNQTVDFVMFGGLPQRKCPFRNHILGKFTHRGEGVRQLYESDFPLNASEKAEFNEIPMAQYHRTKNYEIRRTYLDLSLNKCANLTGMATMFNPEAFHLSYPTPGYENMCPGLKFQVELNEKCIRPHSRTHSNIMHDTCNSWVFHKDLSRTEISICRDKLFRTKEWQRRAENSTCGSVRQNLSYEQFAANLSSNCKTKEEMKRAAYQSLSYPQATIFAAFIEHFSATSPASLATQADFLCWGKSIVSGTAGGAVGFLVGLAKGNSAKFIKILDAISNIFAGLKSMFDFFSDLFDLLEKDNSSNPPDDAEVQNELAKVINETSNEMARYECSIPGDVSNSNRRFKRAPVECKCFFEGKTDLSCDAKDLEGFVSFEELSRNSIENVPYSHGSSHELDLILSRTGVFQDWENPSSAANLAEKFVCKNHHLVLGKQWHNRQSNFRRMRGAGESRKKACQFPNDVEGAGSHRSPVSAMMRGDQWRFITRDQSRALQSTKNVFLPVGSAVCLRHSNYLSDLEAGERIGHRGYDLRPCLKNNFADAPGIRPGTAGAPPYSSCSSEEPSTSSEYQQSQEAAPDSDSEKRRNAMKSDLKSFLKTAGMRDVHFTNNFDELEVQTQRRYAAATKRVLEEVVSLLAEQGTDTLEKMALSEYRREWRASKSKTLDSLIDTVVEVFLSGQTKSDRMQALSLIAPLVTYKDLATRIPGLSKYMFSAARKYAKIYGPGRRLEKISRHRAKLDRKKIESFVYFITSPEMIVDLPFGFTTIKYSSGETEDIPSVIRHLADSRIVQVYRKFMEDIGQLKEAFSVSTLLRMVKACIAKTRKSVHGLDYYTYAGVKAFDVLEQIVGEMKIEEIEDKSWPAATKIQLRAAKQYLKVDYKVKLNSKAYSRTADHCYKFALSDPRNQDFYETCDHEHVNRCESCDQLYLLLEEVKMKIADADWETQRQREVLHISALSVDHIMQWKKHQLRAMYLDGWNEKLIQNLGPTEIFLQCDWAMKFNPEYGTECTTAWYGKRGLGWHVCSALRQVAEGVFLRRDFVHVFDQVRQDGAAVTGVLRHILDVLKAEIPEAEKIFLRSDNAGCYKAASVMSLLPMISQERGIKIKSWSFTESQAGKGPCDRRAADIKRHLRMYRDENNDITTAKEFLKAAKSYGGLRSISFYRGSLQPLTSKFEYEPPAKKARGSRKKKLEPKIPGITTFHEFQFEYNQDGPLLRVWRYPNVGRGSEIAKHLWQVPTESFIFVPAAEEGPEAGAEWTSTASIYGRKEPEPEPEPYETLEEDQFDEVPDTSETAEPTTVYSCPEDGCVSTFMKYGNLLNHLDIGKHKYRPERESDMDYTKRFFKQCLEQMSRGAPSILQNLPESFLKEAGGQTCRIPPLRMGWAIPDARVYKRYDEDVRAYLIDKYDEGERTGLKWNPVELEIQMMRAKSGDRLRFHPDQWLPSDKILSFFSRITSQRRKVKATATHPLMPPTLEHPDTSPVDLGEPEPGEEATADMAYLEDSDYPTPDDEVMAILMESKDELFTTE